MSQIASENPLAP